MKLDSLHNAPIAEKAEQPQGDPLDALRLDAPEMAAPAPEGQEMAPEAQDEVPETDSGHPGHRVDEAMGAVEKLQAAAAALEAAKFMVQTEYSDFTLADSFEQMKQNLIPLIGKIREHMTKTSVKDPQSEKRVASWLDM